MTDLEINLALAKSIGWTDDRIDEEGNPDPDLVKFVRNYNNTCYVAVWFKGTWMEFDFRDAKTIWPIAKRYDCFPQRSKNDSTKWLAWIGYIGGGFADTPEKAVAQAVIRWARP